MKKMEEIVSAVNSTQNADVSVIIKTVTSAIESLKQNGKEKDVKAFLEKTSYDTALEKLVAVKLINAFKLNDNLIKAFATEDLFVISQSLKCDWFFEDDSDMLYDKELVLNFISKLSYSGRCKVIKKYMKILKNTDKAEKLTLILDETFGIQTALELLPACSEPFITEFLHSKDIKLSERWIEQLYLKQPDFTVDYIFYLYEKKKPEYFIYRNILLKLASEKTALFIEFWNKYGNVSCYHNKVSRRLTRKILLLGYSSVLRNYEKYFVILNMKFVVWYLSRDQLEELHFCLLPNKLTEFNENYNNDSFGRQKWNILISLIKNLKKNIAEEILMKNFKKKYGKDPLDTNLSEEVIAFFPQEVKVQWANNKLLDKDLEDYKKAEFSVYLPFDQGFKTFKTLIPLAVDTHERAHRISCMIRNVMIGKHYDGVSQLVSSIVSMLDNHTLKISGDGIINIKEIKESLDMSKVTADQWPPIFELVNISTIGYGHKKEFHSYVMSCIHGNWIQCRLDAGLPIDSEMEMILGNVDNYFDINFVSKTNHEAVVLDWLNSNLQKTKIEEDDLKRHLAGRLFCVLNEFNVSHPDCIIKPKDWIMDEVKKQLSADCLRRSILSSLKKNKPLMYEVYDAIFPKTIFPEILLYKYSHNINDIVENVDLIISEIINEYHYECYIPFFLKILLYKDLSEKMAQSCLKYLNDDPDNNYYRAGVRLLSLLSPKLFLSFIKDCYPKGSQMKNDSTESINMYKIECLLDGALKNVNPPQKSLEALKKYSVREYMKPVVWLILSVSQKISQTRAVEFLKYNLNQPISYKKHLIKTLKLIATKSDFTNELLLRVTNEKNASQRVILFKTILHWLKVEKNKFHWDIVKKCLPAMTNGDIEKLQSRIFSFYNIPLEYQGEYIDIIWATLMRTGASLKTKAQILTLINENTISLISDNFADLLFDMTYQTMKDDSTSLSFQCNKFIALYLCICPREYFEKRLNNVVGLVNNQLCLSLSKKQNIPENMTNLVEAIVETSLLGEVVLDPLHILTSLSRSLLKLFPEHEIHEIISKLLQCQITQRTED